MKTSAPGRARKEVHPEYGSAHARLPGQRNLKLYLAVVENFVSSHYCCFHAWGPVSFVSFFTSQELR